MQTFVGPGPWKVFALAGYIETRSADRAFLHQDVVVGLATDSELRAIGRQRFGGCRLRAG
jgi:hypothetical protein